MAGPGGKEVGRASIRVVPDISGFSRELKAQLTKIEVRNRLNLKVGLDLTGITAQARALRATLEQELRLDNLQARINLDGVALAVRETRQLRAELTAVARTFTARVKVDGLAGLTGLATQVSALNGQSIRIRIDVDGSAQALASLTAISSIVGRLNGQTATVNVDRDGSAKKALGGISSGLGSIVPALGSLAKGAAAFSLLASAASTALPAIAGIAAALGTASGALLILPGVAVAGGLAFGALKLAFSGFGDALSNIGDPKAFAESLEGLTPAAREAATSIKGLADGPFKDLKESLQETFFAGLGPRLADAGNALIGGLGTPLRRIADDAGIAGAGLLELVSGGAGLANVTNIGNQASDAFGDLFAAITPLAGAFLDVASVGADFLPGLTAGAGDAAQSFADMVAAMKESGRLKEIISGGLSALGDLATVAGNVGTAIGGIFRAASASGGGLAGNLIVITQSISDVINSTAGQSALTDFFEVGATVARTLGTVLQTLAPSIAVVLDAFNQGVQALAPVIPGLARAFGGILEAVAPLLPAIGELAGLLVEIFAGALTSLTPAITTLVSALVDGLGPVLPVIGQALSDVFTALGPVIDAFAGVFSSVLTTLAPIVGDLATALASALIPALASLQPAIDALAPVLADVAGQLGTALLDAVVQLAPLLPEIVKAFSDFVVALAPLLPDLAELAISLLPVAVEVIKELLPIVLTLAGYFTGSLVPAVQDVSDKISTAAGYVRGFADTMAVQRDRISSVVENIGGIFGALRLAVASAIADAVNTVTELPGRARAALGSLGDTLAASGRALIQGFIDGIKSRIGDMVGAISGALSSARELFPFSPAKKGPFSGRGWVLYSGQSVAEGFAEGINSRAGLATSATASLMSMAQGNLSGLSVTAGVGPTATATAAPYAVNVYLGTREITDIVGTEIQQASQQSTVNAYAMGVRV